MTDKNDASTRVLADSLAEIVIAHGVKYGLIPEEADYSDEVLEAAESWLRLQLPALLSELRAVLVTPPGKEQP